MMRRHLLAAGLAVAVTGVAGPAYAAWQSGGTGTATATAARVQAPASASAAPTTGATSTSITVSWTAPSSGPAPTGYRVDRVSPAATVCTVPATALTCNDIGRTPGTSYSYNVRAIVSNWNGTASAASAATAASADTTPPVTSANCPVSGGSYSNASNNGSGTWNKACPSGLAVNATDAVGVASVAVKLSKAGVCWNGTDSGSTGFSSAACSATGPAGYPAGYVSLTAASGSSWTRALSGPSLSTGTWSLEALAKDAASNTSTTLSFSFTIIT